MMLRTNSLTSFCIDKHGRAKSVRDAEAQADAFAAAFLMPKPSVEANVPKFASVAELIRLKHIWGTSVSAVNYRFHRLGFISDWHYRQLCVQLSSRGYRIHEPQEGARESSALIPQLLLDLYRRDKLTRSAIAGELGYPISELNQLLFGLTISAIESPFPRRGNPKLSRNSPDLQLVENEPTICSSEP
jgi:IrrE N-terminal-like domain